MLSNGESCYTKCYPMINLILNEMLSDGESYMLYEMLSND